MKRQKKAKKGFAGYLIRSMTDLKGAFAATRMNLFIIALYDLLFGIFMIAAIMLAVKSMKGGISRVSAIDITSVVANPAAGEQVVSTLRNFIIQLGLTVIIVLLVMIIAWSIFKGIAWANVRRKEFTRDYFMRFLLTSLAWFISLAIIFIFLIYSAKPDAATGAMRVYLLLAGHFTWLLCLVYTKYGTVWDSIRNTLYFGTLRIHYIILPYLVLALLIIVFGQLFWVIKLLPQTGSFIAKVVWVLVVFAFSKIYLAKALERYI